MANLERKDLINPLWWGPKIPSMPDPLVALLARKFPAARPWPAPEGVLSIDTAADPAFLRALADLGAGVTVRVDPVARARVALGLGSEDLVRARLGDLPQLPVAVIEPSDHKDVVGVLRLCQDAGVKVVPRGGGTSVTGAVNVPAGAVVLDLSARMNRVLAPASNGGGGGNVVRAQAGILGPALEAAARENRRTVGHFPQSFERSTLGGWIAARSAGQYSSRYGRAEEMVVGLRAATPVGDIVVDDRPASAVGPEPLALLAGSEGGLAVITEATVRTLAHHDDLYATAWLMPGFAAGVNLARRLSEDGLPPSALRLSDENETERLLAAAHLSRVVRGTLGWLQKRRPQSLLLVIADGAPDEIAVVRRRVRAAALGAGAVPLGAGPARQWIKTRFSQPALRDALLEAGIIADTMETAAPWPRAVALCEAVRAAATPLGADVGVHVSHVYPDGCSLYFTLLTAPSPAEAVDHLVRVREAVARAFLSQGCPLSHHHGAGRYLAPFVRTQIGPVALSALQAMKRQLDPAGILNPGIALDNAPQG